MLEAIRKHAKGWAAKVILAVIAVTFALFGVDSYMQGGDGADIVAVVGEAKISRQEYSRELENQADRMREAMGEKFDRAITDTPEFRKKMLDSLVERKALLLDAQQQGFQTPDRYLESVLVQIPAFQENGVFSPQRFEALLRQRNMTPAGFEKEVREAYVLEMQTSPIVLGTFVPKTSLSQLVRVVLQQREISTIDLPASEFNSQANVSEADIKKYYTSHPAEFTEPEKLRAEYLALTPDSILPTLTLNDKEVGEYYAANSARFSQPEQRSASHILITVAKNAAPGAKERARDKAVKLTASLQKNPADFAELARKESQDPGSAAQNGSLGSFPRGAMVKPFDDAVFGMKVGEIRGPVESEFGFHIIRLDGIQSATVMPLNSVRAEIETELRKQKAQKRFAEAAENFSNLVYEKADSLKPAAEAMRLTVQTTGWISAKNPPPPLNNPKLIQILFSADAIGSKQNTEAVEVAPGVLIAARVLEHRPSAMRPLSEVAEKIRQKLRTERNNRLITDKGNALIAQLRRGNESSVPWSDFKIVSRRENAGLDPASLAVIFRADTQKLPAYTGWLNRDGSYRIARITRVLDASQQDPALVSSIQAGVRQALQRADLLAMVALAKSSRKIEIREATPDVK